MPLICLDAGHNSYGPDTGATGNGLKEQDLTLAIAKETQRLLEANKIKVVMTRIGDYVTGLPSNYTLNQSLMRRVEIANSNGADLFISTHINAGKGTGSEVYAISDGGNATKLARIIAPKLSLAGNWSNRGVKFSNFYVIKNTAMPAILTENGFIDTVQDADKLKQQFYITALAEAHAKGVCEYLGITYSTSNSNAPEPPKNAGESKGEFSMKNAILLYGVRDISGGLFIQEALNSNAGIFNRNGTPTNIPEDAKNAAKLYVVGGPPTGLSNEIYLSGKTGADTVALVADYCTKTLGYGG